MSTVTGAGTIVTSRDLTVLRTLLIARVLDGVQVMTVAGFASLRRTNRRLLKLVQARLLKRWFVGTASGGQKALYGLSRKVRISSVRRPRDSFLGSRMRLSHRASFSPTSRR